MEQKTWQGSTAPSNCEVCGGEFGEYFYDAKTKHGPWALMCHNCMVTTGVGLGTGKGQKYRTDTLEKVGS